MSIHIHKYWQTWKMTAFNALEETFVDRGTNIMFFIGKTIRFIIMLMFLLLLRQNVQDIGGYSSAEILVFFVTYQFIDTLAQTLYRGVYVFGNDVRSGKFDGTLTRPINVLFSVLTGQPDINDAFFIIPSAAVSVYLLAGAGLNITPLSAVLYLALLVNSMILATALHILIVSVTILTTDVDNMIWMYRDVTRLGQFPVTMYFELIRLSLFFIIPIGMMFTIPSQVLFNGTPTYSLALVTGFTVIFFWISLKIWQRALRTYSSASS